MTMYQQGYVSQTGVDWDMNPTALTGSQVIAYLTARGVTDQEARFVISNACDSKTMGSRDGVPMTPFLRLRVMTTGGRAGR
jgi:hypothetical protein